MRATSAVIAPCGDLSATPDAFAINAANPGSHTVTTNSLYPPKNVTAALTAARDSADPS